MCTLLDVTKRVGIKLVMPFVPLTQIIGSRIPHVLSVIVFAQIASMFARLLTVPKLFAFCYMEDNN